MFSIVFSHMQASMSLLLLGWVDLAVIIIYFAMVLGIGFYLKRHARTGDEFFCAGREATAWVAGLSFLAANLGSLELMAGPPLLTSTASWPRTFFRVIAR
jgi:SSS family solute:Na+ symporter